MIYLFVGEKYFRKKLIDTWKKSFAEKFSENNIIHVQNPLQHDIWFFEQNLLSNGLFSTKNLFIIDDFPFSSDDENPQNILKMQEYFLDIFPRVNTENIVVFNNLKADKRSKLYKKIKELWEIKDFIIETEEDLRQKLQQVYQNKVSSQVIDKMITLKGLQFSNITWEFDKILIVKENIDISDIQNISQDLEENIFEIINLLLSSETKKSILKLRELASQIDNSYLLYNSLLSNLRVYFYIFQLQKLWKTNSEIKELLDLWNREFLIGKTYKIKKETFFKMYEKLMWIDAKMKTGKMFGSESDDMMYEIERSLII